MRTDSTLSDSAGAEPQRGARPQREDKPRWELFTLEQSVCVALYVFAVFAMADRWLPDAALGFLAMWLFPYCWAAMLARRAKSEGLRFDITAAPGRRLLERALWRALIPAVGLCTLLLVPVALLEAVMASFSWWQRSLAYLGGGLLIGLLRRLWRAWRSRPSA
jgi:hypothetical protein